jgi:peptide/nickel transport system permease protein
MHNHNVFQKLVIILSGMLHRPSGKIGLLLVFGHIFLAIISPLIVPFDFAAMDYDLVMTAPSGAHWFGADALGRDVLTRTMLGGRQALFVTCFSAFIAVFWGGLSGLFFGLAGGRIDDILMRVVDAFMSIPWILFLLLIVAMVGTGPMVLIPTLGFFYGIPVIRIARAATHDVVARDFITAARARGEKRLTIVKKELVPNILDVLLVEGAMRWSWMLLAFSSLSFLGFGVSPPTPDWGLMISDSRSIMSIAPWAALAPVVALSSLIVGLNLCADSLAKTLGVDRAQQVPV